MYTDLRDVRQPQEVGQGADGSGQEFPTPEDDFDVGREALDNVFHDDKQ